VGDLGQLGLGSDVGFVDNGVPQRYFRSPVLPPVKILGIDHHRFGHLIPVSFFRKTEISLGISRDVAHEALIFPVKCPFDGLGIWIEKEFVGVETVSIPGLVGSIHRVPIKLSLVGTFYPDMPNIAGPVNEGIQSIRDLGLGIAASCKEMQSNRGGIPAEQSEVRPVVMQVGSQDVGDSRTVAAFDHATSISYWQMPIVSKYRRKTLWELEAKILSPITFFLAGLGIGP
jgi:hypothetical protein